MIKNINHFSFTVQNLEKSIVFYRNVLGLKLKDISTRSREFSENVTGIKNAELYIAYMETINACIELIEYRGVEGKKILLNTCDIGSSHICFNVDEFEDLVQKLKENNVQFNGKICCIPEGPNKGKKVVYFRDIDGNTIELISIK